MLGPGTSVDKYTIERQLAVGGMAITYLASRIGAGGFRKRVVIKVMRPEHFEDESFTHMFLDEARLCARLNHTALVQVFELGDHFGLPYMVMEYVHGPGLHRLHKRLSRERLARPLSPIVFIGVAIAEALDYAAFGKDSHGRPLEAVHRDVSLANILVDQGGQAKLIDFGIAKSGDEQLHQTEVGAIKGRVMYMAPEQLRGKPVDSRSDVYSLGACLYTMTTGVPPFGAAKAGELLQRRLSGNGVKRPTELVSGFPPALEAVLLKAMAEDPNDRYQRPKHLARALRDCLGDCIDDIDREGVAAWIKEVFPEGEASWTPSRFSPTNTASWSSSAIQSGIPAVANEPVTGTVVTHRAAGVMAIAVMLMLVLSMAAGFGLYSMGQSNSQPGSMEADQSASVFMEEAKRLVADGKHRRANELLLEAQELPIGDAAITIELNALLHQTGRAMLVGRAKKALEIEDYDDALVAIRWLFELDPEDAEAAALFVQVRAAREPAQEGAPQGRLSVSTTPAAMIFVDDEPVGQSPVTLSLPEGSHRVTARKSGYNSKSDDFEIEQDQTNTLSLVLSKRAKRDRPAPPAAAPEPVVVVTEEAIEPVEEVADAELADDDGLVDAAEMTAPRPRPTAPHRARAQTDGVVRQLPVRLDRGRHGGDLQSACGRIGGIWHAARC